MQIFSYPDEAINNTDPVDPAAALVSVQSVVIDPSNRLWILDTGSPLSLSVVLYSNLYAGLPAGVVE
jgi:hypothetical protein